LKTRLFALSKVHETLFVDPPEAKEKGYNKILQNKQQGEPKSRKIRYRSN